MHTPLNYGLSCVGGEGKGGGRGDSGGEEIGGEARLRCLVKLLLGDRVMHTGKFVRGFNE